MGMSENGGKHTQTVDRISYPNEAEHASDLRSFVGDFMGRAGVEEQVADEILMAVGEVVANACVHGRPRTRTGSVELKCAIHRAHIVVTVIDDGHGFDVDAVLGDQVPDLLSQGGRGFFLMRQLMDQVEVDSSSGGTTVTVRRHLPR